jgi:hypothetical protein
VDRLGLTGIAPRAPRLFYDQAVNDRTSHTWTCSSCGRRVPSRVEVCHCGTTREQIAAAPSAGEVGNAPLARTLPRDWRGFWASLPRDVRAFTAATALVLVAGLGWLVFGPRQPDATPALLGYVDNRPARSPESAQRRPPFKLPWWK